MNRLVKKGGTGPSGRKVADDIRFTLARSLWDSMQPDEPIKREVMKQEPDAEVEGQEFPLTAQQAHIAELHASDWKGAGGYSNARRLHAALRDYQQNAGEDEDLRAYQKWLLDYMRAYHPQR